MQWIVESRLRERAVFEAARRDPATADLYHRVFAGCHTEPDPLRREKAFDALHIEWWEQLGLAGMLRDVVAEFPFVRRSVNTVAVHSAAGRRGTGAELFGRTGEFRLLICLLPAMLLDRQGFQYWFRHELLHIDDILDPAFAYDPDAMPRSSSDPVAGRLRDRFAVLWAMSVDARLSARTQAHPDARSTREREFCRVFDLKPKMAKTKLKCLWEQLRSFRPMQPTLLRWAGSCDAVPPLGEAHADAAKLRRAAAMSSAAS